MNETGACCGYGADRATLRRQRITEAARKLFITNGFHATGVAQIAKESGVAVGQIYRDFEAKEDIVAQIVEGDAKKFVLRETLQRAISENDSAAVWAWIRQFVEPSKCLDTNQLFADTDRLVANIMTVIEHEIELLLASTPSEAR